MKDIKIEKTHNNTYVIKANTDRFGDAEIMYESFKLSDCIRWLEGFKKYGLKLNEKIYTQVVDIILENMPLEKRVVLSGQVNRNNELTSHRGMSSVYLYFTENGITLEMEGTRSYFRVFMDNFSRYRRLPNNEIKGKKPIIMSRLCGVEGYLDRFI